MQPISRQIRDLPRVMFIEPPVTQIPRPPPQPQPYSYDDDTDDVKFEPPASPFSSSSSDAQEPISSHQRPGSLDSGSMDQQTETTDSEDHTTRSLAYSFMY